MGYKYSFNGEGEHAKSLGTSVPISPKQAREISKNIRGMKLEQAKRYLEEVTLMQRAVAFKRHNRDVGHKKGMAAGRYPVKASTVILTLLKTAEANAQHKGMSVGDLVVTHIVTNRDAAQLKYGRQRGVVAKRAHVEIILEEKKIEEKIRKKASKKAEKKAVAEQKEAAPKPVEKKEAMKAEKPAEEKKVEKPVAAEAKVEEKKTEKPVEEKKPEEKKAEEKPAEKKEEVKETPKND